MEVAKVYGVSMQLTIHNNSFVLYDTNYSGYKKGDIVVAISPKGKYIIKRVLDISDKDGTVFLVGDNTKDSIDSRKWGRIPITNIIGRVKLSWQKNHRAKKKIKKH